MGELIGPPRQGLNRHASHPILYLPRIIGKTDFFKNYQKFLYKCVINNLSRAMSKTLNLTA